MTGIECLREEMRNRGLTEAQINSKAVSVVIDILAQANGKYIELVELEHEVKLKQEQQAEAERLYRYATFSRQRLIESLKGERDGWYKENKAYLEEVMQALSECETAEGRDAIRIAQTFINSVDVDTKYDNTAFIIGLASILACWKTTPIDRLRKINTQLPDVNISEDGSWNMTMKFTK